MNNNAIFFLSTGRCGTQWFGKVLSDTYQDLATVTHEPIKTEYRPKEFLRAYDDLEKMLANEVVSDHFNMIKEVLDEKIYIEAGWPCYPAIPLLHKKLNQKIKVVHLIRHPINTALSLATHNIYSRNDWISDGAITPDDKGVKNKELEGSWPSLTMYEKCLYWWTEINAYALELQVRYPEIDFHFVRFEDLFSSDNNALQELIEFMGLPYRDDLDKLKGEPVDVCQYKSKPVDWELIYKYPHTIALMKEFGYEISNIENKEINSRYFSGYLNKFFSKIKNRIFRMFNKS